ncbi:MAG: RloB domain-containing protein [Cyanobacteria bacterium]|jgi:hypothetical protein|nr:RloB domain-containing protein [Cyanobacteria bacterium GSL.Bin21]
MSKKRPRKSRRGHSNRTTQNRKLRARFLIICEGTKTEPKYFKDFRVPADVIELDIIGLGKNPSKLVEKAQELKVKKGYEEELDQTWCVFDRDKWTTQDFNQAIQYAYQAGFNIAYSNECFELWYLLHFCYLDTALNSKEYENKLSHYLGHIYEKESDDMYEKLQDKQNTAIKNAEKLLKQHAQTNPAVENPSTTVHWLVKELNQFIP